MHHRLSISQRLYGLTDNAWAYGTGLGMVSAAVIAWMDIFGGFDSSSEGNIGISLTIVTVGSLGMTIGGKFIYSAIQWPGRPVERALLFTMAVPFAAVVITALLGIVFFIVGFLLAVLLGLVMMPVAVIVTACWSAIYLSLPARERIPLYAVGAYSGERSPSVVIAGSLVLLAAIAAVLWFMLGCRVGIEPPTYWTCNSR